MAYIICTRYCFAEIGPPYEIGPGGAISAN